MSKSPVQRKIGTNPSTETTLHIPVWSNSDSIDLIDIPQAGDIKSLLTILGRGTVSSMLCNVSLPLQKILTDVLMQYITYKMNNAKF